MWPCLKKLQPVFGADKKTVLHCGSEQVWYVTNCFSVAKTDSVVARLTRFCGTPTSRPHRSMAARATVTAAAVRMRQTRRMKTHTRQVMEGIQLIASWWSTRWSWWGIRCSLWCVWCSWWGLGVVDDALGVVDNVLGAVDVLLLGVVDDVLGAVDDVLGVGDDAIGVVDSASGAVDDALGVVDNASGAVMMN